MDEAASHSIHVDHARKLIDVRLRGFLTPEDSGWVGEEVRAAIRTLGDDVGSHVTLYDVTEMQVAPGETIEAVQRSFAHPAVRPLWARKVAVVTGSVLGRMQMQRLRRARPDIELFDDREAAMDWLFS